MNQSVNQISADDRKGVLRRLKKILALSESSNPGEAAAALHQADAIMKKFGITKVDAEISSVEESETALSSAELNKWESALFSVVAASLGVSAFVSGYKKVRGVRRPRAKIIFVGEGFRAQVAAYAFETLRRKLKIDLKQSFNSILTQAGVDEDVKRSLKMTTLQRDAYALNWCHAVKGKVAGLAPEVPKSVLLYLETRIGVDSRETPQPKKSKPAKPLDALASYMASKGRVDGQSVELHKAVNRDSLDVKQIACAV
jgi:hypothetical protein